jgi:hypothetical protein
LHFIEIFCRPVESQEAPNGGFAACPKRSGNVVYLDVIPGNGRLIAGCDDGANEEFFLGIMAAAEAWLQNVSIRSSACPRGVESSMSQMQNVVVEHGESSGI